MCAQHWRVKEPPSEVFWIVYSHSEWISRRKVTLCHDSYIHFGLNDLYNQLSTVDAHVLDTTSQGNSGAQLSGAGYVHVPRNVRLVQQGFPVPHHQQVRAGAIQPITPHMAQHGGIAEPYVVGTTMTPQPAMSLTRGAQIERRTPTIVRVSQ